MTTKVFWIQLITVLFFVAVVVVFLFCFFLILHYSVSCFATLKNACPCAGMDGSVEEKSYFKMLGLTFSSELD